MNSRSPRVVTSGMNPRRGTLGDAVRVVEDDDRRRSPRYQLRSALFQDAVGTRDGEERMAHAVLAVLANVEERQFAGASVRGVNPFFQ